MSEQGQLKNYKPRKHSGTPVISTEEKQKIFLFQVPKDFDAQQLNGVEIDKKSLEIQSLENEEYGVKKLNEETSKFIKQQLLLMYPQKNKTQLVKGKPFSGVYKVMKTYGLPKLNRKAIRKTIPIRMVDKQQNDEEEEE